MTSLDDTARRPTDIPRLSNPNPFLDVGVSGTAVFGGYLEELEKDSRLGSTQRYKTYSDILANTSIVSAGVRFFLNLVAKAAWKLEPADDSPEAKHLSELTSEIFHDMETPWHRVVRRATMFKFYGFSVQEITAKRRPDGVIGLLDVDVRPQRTIERWDTTRTGKVLGVIQRSPQTQENIYIPRSKLLYLVDDSLNDSPEGLGLFRHLVEPARRLGRYEQLEGFGYEGDLRGIPIARAPLMALQELVEAGKLSQAAADSATQVMKDFVERHVKNPQLGLLLDSQPWLTSDEKQSPSTKLQWDIELLDGGEYSLAEVAAAIQRVNQEIARILNVEQLLMGGTDRGSHAMSKDKSQSLGLVVDSTLKELTEQFQRDLITRVWELNGWDLALMPKFKVEQVAYRDIEQVGIVLENLATAGVPLTRKDEAVLEVFDALGLSRLDPALEPEPPEQPTNEPDTPTDPSPPQGD